MKTFAVSIFCVVIFVAGWLFYELAVVTYVPSYVAELVEQQCRIKGGLRGDWPVVTNGYLLATKKSPGDRRNPYRDTFLTDGGFDFMEYSLEAIGNSFHKPYRKGYRSDQAVRREKIDSPYVRVTLEDIGHELCGDVEIEARYNRGFMDLPNSKCMAIVKLNDESELWSRYEWRDEWITEDSTAQSIDWKVLSVIDRKNGVEIASMRSFLMCLSDWTRDISSGGIGGCRRNFLGAETLFECPARRVRESKLHQRELRNFRMNVIRSSLQSPQNKEMGKDGI